MGLFDELEDFFRDRIVNNPITGTVPRAAFEIGSTVPRAAGNFIQDRIIDNPVTNPFYERPQDRIFAKKVHPQPFSARSPERQSGTDTLGPLLEQLLMMLTQPTAVDRNAIMSDVRGQLDPIYDARIQQAEGTAERGTQDIEAMYEALSQDYEELAPEQAEQAAQTQQEVDQLYNELKTTIEGNYTRIADEQTDLLKQLGIEEAAPAVLGPQNERRASAATRADELGAINEQRYIDIGDIDETYYREGAPLANLTGANRSSDLLQQLQSFVQMTEAERTAGINQAFSQAFSTAQNRAAQRQSQQEGMLFNILQAQLQGSQSGELTPESFLSSLPTQLQSNVGSALRNIERSPEAVSGRQELEGHPVPGTFVPLTDEWWLDAVDKMYSSGEISDATRQALVMFLRLRAQ